VWSFESDKGKPISFKFQPFLNSNSGVLLLEATRKGLGIARLPDFVASEGHAAGQLVLVLPDLKIPSLEIYLVHAENRRLNRRMRLFAEFIKQACLSEP
jgi:DNA-binding transcriptional LysR family regulator